MSNRSHIFLLGAGASCAAFPEGDRNRKLLPTLANLVSTVGLEDLLQGNGYSAEVNFEQFYSSLCRTPGTEELRIQLEDAIADYFSSLELPSEPTLYDRLVLCLRPKDLIASFNWDPFLWQSCSRLAKRYGASILPKVVYLHGSVAVSYCFHHEPPTMGDARTCICNRCKGKLTKSRLLFPVEEKNYNSEITISHSWKILQNALPEALLFSVFGYSAPATDVEAIDLLTSAWGDPSTRIMEQVEIINTDSCAKLYKSWKPFILREHYSIQRSFFESYAALHPRRSCEHHWQAYGMNNPQEETPIPPEGGWAELEEWLKPLITEEKGV